MSEGSESIGVETSQVKGQDVWGDEGGETLVCVSRCPEPKPYLGKYDG